MKLIVLSLVVASGARAALGQGLDLSRAYAAELRADAAARTSELDGSDCGHDGKRFVLSDGGNNTLYFGGLVQARWYGNFRDVPGPSNDFTEGFSLRRTRFDFSGTILDKRFSYDLRFESDRGTGNYRPLEAFGRYNITNEVYVRFGQFKLPLNREEILSTSAQLAIDRSVTDAAFAESYSEGAEVGYQ
ncbi:MAG: porin, partial [Phycisphaerales bacterium]